MEDEVKPANPEIARYRSKVDKIIVEEVALRAAQDIAMRIEGVTNDNIHTYLEYSLDGSVLVRNSPRRTIPRIPRVYDPAGRVVIPPKST